MEVVRKCSYEGNDLGDPKVDLSKFDKKQRKFYLELEAWYQDQEKNNPPMISDEVGEIDVSGAVFVKVSGRRLKKRNMNDYYDVVDFMYNCRHKRYLQLFYSTGDQRMGGLASTAGKRVPDEDHHLAALAISKYQEVEEGVKLKLRDVMKINYVLWNLDSNYITFSAENEDTCEIKTYQAALAEHDNGYLLGLFRDAVDAKILAVLSVTGARDDYDAKVENYENARNPLRKQKSKMKSGN